MNDVVRLPRFCTDVPGISRSICWIISTTFPTRRLSRCFPPPRILFTIIARQRLSTLFHCNKLLPGLQAVHFLMYLRDLAEFQIDRLCHNAAFSVCASGLKMPPRCPRNAVRRFRQCRRCPAPLPSDRDRALLQSESCIRPRYKFPSFSHCHFHISRHFFPSFLCILETPKVPVSSSMAVFQWSMHIHIF